MKAVVQRVSEAKVVVDGKETGSIEEGLLVYLGVGADDQEEQINVLVDKIIKLRIFEDENGKINLSLLDKKGSILVVSQFTLYADCSKGRRPSFFQAAPPAIAENLYNQFIEVCKEKEIPTSSGIFGADMKVSSVNDGPFTITLEI